ncbi:MAG: 3-deoxy-manno-octulosonate cytidylyltransferase [Candidatus Omnitrophota bacterium]
MDVIGVIPARYGSTRFEGKVLADIHGKPMIQWVWEAAKKAKILDEVIVACDDKRIEEAVKSFGGKAVFTSKEHICGTDRICEVVNPLEVKVIVNIQADEPLLDPVMIENVARPLLDNPALNMATLMKRIDGPQEASDPNVVKVLTDKNGLALYFSRLAIPYQQDKSVRAVYYKHIGLYAYTKDFLFIFKNLPESYLEKMEKLEQLRVLEAGFKIKVIETKVSTIGVDTPEDLEKAKKVIS